MANDVLDGGGGGGGGGAGAFSTIRGSWACPSVTIGPGETCELRFSFIPQVVASYSGKIVMDTDDPGSPYTFNWVGEGHA